MWRVLLEARTGVEPVNKGFADLCLTTWLPRPIQDRLSLRHGASLRTIPRDACRSQFNTAHRLGAQTAPHSPAHSTKRYRILP